MQFKIGDKVKIIHDICWHKLNQTGIIIYYVDEFKHYFVETSTGGSFPYYEEDLVLIGQLQFSFMNESLTE